MKLWLGITIMVLITFLCGYLALTSLFNITNPPPRPWILVKNTNISNPDIASFKNCTWSEADKVIIPNDKSKPFSFGYLYDIEYRVVTVDTTKDPHFDDSAAFWGGLEDNGEVWGYYPCDIQRPPTPSNAKFLRPIRQPKSKATLPKKKEIEVPTTKEMKRA